MNSQTIQSFHVKGLWNEKDVVWDHINSDMNILVGINGSGKTTLLNLMYAYYYDPKTFRNIRWNNVSANPEAGDLSLPPAIYIRNLDIPTKRKDESPLLLALEEAVYQNKKSSSFFSYRMKMIDYPDQYHTILQRIDKFTKLVNEMFIETGKKMQVRDSQFYFKNANGNVCELKDLSSGEKQLLLILLRVFLMEQKPGIVFLDEPEISLHIGWQQQLLDILVELGRGNLQFFVTTHSPSMFGRGWGNKVVYMEDIVKPANQ